MSFSTGISCCCRCSEELLLQRIQSARRQENLCFYIYCSCLLVFLVVFLSCCCKNIVARFLHPQGVYCISRFSGDSSTDGLTGLVHLTDTPRSRSPNLRTSLHPSSLRFDFFLCRFYCFISAALTRHCRKNRTIWGRLFTPPSLAVQRILTKTLSPNVQIEF